MVVGCWWHEALDLSEWQVRQKFWLCKHLGFGSSDHTTQISPFSFSRVQEMSALERGDFDLLRAEKALRGLSFLRDVSQAGSQGG